MTLQARLVLEDCRGALADLTDGTHGPQWRRRWVATLVLLRAVGHVLDKVDGRNDPFVGRAVAAAWTSLVSTKPEPKIFWQFIDDERNAILKEYQVGAGHNTTIYVGTGRPPEYEYVINTGPYKGRLQQEVVQEAIRWWEQYLDGIDAAAIRG